MAALAALCLAVFAAPACAADPYEFNALYSLTGDCSVDKLDPVKDPSCPEEPPSGRFDTALSIAVDFYGNEYVANSPVGTGASRIDIFDDEARFIGELLSPLGDPVSMAVDSAGNLYVIESPGTGGVFFVRYSPTVYEPEAGKIEYGTRVVIDTSELTGNAGVAIDPATDQPYVGWNSNFITEYASAAEGNKALDTITHENMHLALMLGIDGERRRLYTSSCKDGIFDCRVLVFSLDPPYTLLEELDGSNTPIGDFLSAKGWLSTAVNEETGHFFIADLETSTRRIHEFDENYGYVSSIASAAFQGGRPLQIAFNNSPLDKEAENRHFLFVPNPLAVGRALAFNPPAECTPIVTSPTARDIGEAGAELQATIDPCGGDTSYVFKYVTEEEFDQEGFAAAEIGGEGTISKESQPTQVSASLAGLTPGATYRFLVVATNKQGSDEESGLFATYPAAPSPPPGGCANQMLRAGLSSSLPDCRAYELVTPPDTNGRPPKGVGFTGDRFATLQVSPLGTAVSFTTEGGSLPGHEGTGGFNGDPYRAERSASGWITVSTGPNGTETNNLTVGSTSPDQGYGFWGAGGEGSAVVDGERTNYVQYPDGRAELVGRGSLGSAPFAEGKLITEGGDHIVFQTNTFEGAPAPQLEPNAPPAGTEAVYDRTIDPVSGVEKTHVVSLLPGDVTPPAGDHATYLGASADGAGIAFEIDDTLYLRKDNAITYEIGESVEFAGVSERGERIFYVEGGDLYAFDTATEGVIAFTSVGNASPVNVAPEGARAYFASTSVIPGAGQNPNGTFAKAGQQNLYLSEEGVVTFVATVTARDVEGTTSAAGLPTDGLGLWTYALVSRELSVDPSRVTTDGSVLLFQSRANLDGYDPQGPPQIYRYDDVADRLHCVSCIPTRAAAAGGASLQTVSVFQGGRPPFSAFGFVPNLRADGKRAFFESREALVSTDTDGVQDVYEWEEAGVGSCTRPGGCVYLISSGQSARDNYLFGVSRSGDDAFFITEDVLVAGDNDTASIYDARVGGGFPEAPEKECVGEGCRPVLVPLPAQIEPERPVQGNENFTRRKCPKGKRKVKRNGKVRCVKKKQQRKHKQRRAGSRRGGAK